MTEPLKLSFEVHCSPQTAFRTWTSRASMWWPFNHSVSGESGIRVIFEEHVGGRIFERTPSGVEHEWGRMKIWEPPLRLAYTWHLRSSPHEATAPTPTGRERLTQDGQPPGVGQAAGGRDARLG